MIRRRVLRILCVVALGLALFDSVADAADCDGSNTAAATCHSCACGPHLVSPDAVQIAAAPPPAPYASFKPTPYAFLRPSSVFRPPCLAA